MNKKTISFIIAVLLLIVTLTQVTAQSDSRLGVFPVNSDQCVVNNHSQESDNGTNTSNIVIKRPNSHHLAICVPHGICTPWSECESGEQVRSCKDIVTCGNDNLMPETKRVCEVSNKEDSTKNKKQDLIDDGSISSRLVKENIDLTAGVKKQKKELNPVSEPKTSIFDSINWLPYIIGLVIVGLFIFVALKKRKSN